LCIHCAENMSISFCSDLNEILASFLHNKLLLYSTGNPIPSSPTVPTLLSFVRCVYSFRRRVITAERVKAHRRSNHWPEWQATMVCATAKRSTCDIPLTCAVSNASFLGWRCSWGWIEGEEEGNDEYLFIILYCLFHLLAKQRGRTV